jgi:hypothetical protein
LLGGVVAHDTYPGFQDNIPLGLPRSRGIVALAPNGGGLPSEGRVEKARDETRGR